jgi:glycosyltransferase involved in cell wall biosynthesis
MNAVTRPLRLAHRRRPADPAAAPVVLDARVVTGSEVEPDKTILNSPRYLAQSGYRMVCGYLHPPGDPGFAEIATKATRAGAPLVSIPDRGPWDWRVVGGLLDACRRERVAVWHGHDDKTNLLGLLLRRHWPMRLVTTAHQAMRAAVSDRLALRRYERVICSSEDLVETCVRAGVLPDRCVLLENAIDTAEYRRRQPAELAKAALGLPPDGLVVGAVGRIEPSNGFDLLIRAVAALAGRGLGVWVLVVGDGGDRGRLEQLAGEFGVADRFRLVGRRADVRGFFEAMDVFTLCAGLPNVLLEAMALEVPAVAARVAGVSALVQDGRTGLLVKPGDRVGLTRSLHALLTNPGLRQTLSRAARRAVETRFSFPVRMQKLTRIYDELLSDEGADHR